ncbi:3-dehydroquinate synthase [Kangiella japonica]|uniref:3-dehydroquinate synthase n=1 Tax=Kangiella japonica TaxID=647384 RepID=A0ABN0SXH5_9GAMM
MNILDLQLPNKSSDYQILIGNGLLLDVNNFLPVIKGQQVFIVSNETVAPIYLEHLKKTLSQFEIHSYILKDGEKYKSLSSLEDILDSMLNSGLRRNATLIALGGGVVGDIGGFAAAIYQRGINFIQVPTTVLSQVDSSVGGKTAVNHPLGKNMIGAFHQPVRVITDLYTLKTLSNREFLAGIAEIIKAAIIADRQLFYWLENNSESILAQEIETLSTMIHASCSIKAKIVCLDEKEQGVRAWLNLGHTFGHAIERVLGFGELLHGEAVAIGIVMATEYSVRLGLLSSSESEAVRRLIQRFGLPTTLDSMNFRVSASDLVSAMALDKKNVDADLTLILPKAIGKVTIRNNIKTQDVEQFIEQFLEFKT